MKTTTLYIKVGQRLRQLRLNKGWTQEHLAFEAEVNRTYVGVIEHGKKQVSLAVLEKLARVLGVSLLEFFRF